MKKRLSKSLLVIIIIAILINTNAIVVYSTTVAVSKITLNKSSITLNVGETNKLTAIVNPSNATNKQVTWSSNNSNVASVDSSGSVTAKASGKCTITAKSDNGKTATCTINVSLNTSNPNKSIFNQSVINSTVWPIQEITLYSDDTLKTKIGTLSALTEALVVDKSGTYVDKYKLKITSGTKTGWVDPKYLLINLPDIRSDIIYNITNAYSSIFKIGSEFNKCQSMTYNTYQTKDWYTSGSVSITNITGRKLYTYDNDGTNDGKVYNPKLGRYEFVCPVLYQFAVKIGVAQNVALQNGYCLKIYDGYRPQNICNNFWTYTSQTASATQKADYLTSARVSGNGTCYTNGYTNITCFVAKYTSDHAEGVAVDVTLVYKESKKEIPAQSDMHDLSSNSVKWVNKGNSKNWGTDFTDILNSIMTSQTVGMKPLAYEWWHYSDPNVVLKNSSGSYVYASNNVKYNDKIPLTATITYNRTNITNETVITTITANKQLKAVSGWTLSSDKKKLTKTYNKNANETVNITDYTGKHTISKTISINNIDTDKPIISSVTGNPNSWTNNNVTLAVNAQDVGNSGIAAYSFDGGSSWQTSNKKTYSKNTSGISIKVKDKAGNIVTYSTNIDITKIDKTAPTISSVTGNSNSWTNNNVTLAVNAQDVGNSGIAAYSFDGGSSWQTSNKKTYSKNTTGISIKVKDKAGNIVTYSTNIDITKIDKTAPQILSVIENSTSTTSDNVTLTVNAQDNESGIKEYSFDSGNSWSTNNTKTYSKNTTISGKTIRVRDNAGNVSTYDNILNIKMPNENKSLNVEINYSELTKTNQPVIVTIKVDTGVKEVTNWTLSEDGKTLERTYDNNVNEKITLVDATNEDYTEDVEINIQNIDKEGPIVNVAYEKIEDNKVKAILISNEEMRELTDWELSESKLELSKIYENDAEEKLTIQDTIGNKTVVTVKVDIKEDVPDEDLIKSVNYSETDYTNEEVKVTIRLNRAIKEVDGWNLSDEGKILERTFKENYNDTITIVEKDNEENEQDIIININNIIVLGDINEDKKINISDLLFLKRHLIAGSNEYWKLNEKELIEADINKDGKVNISDLLLLKRVLVVNI